AVSSSTTNPGMSGRQKQKSSKKAVPPNESSLSEINRVIGFSGSMPTTGDPASEPQQTPGANVSGGSDSAPARAMSTSPGANASATDAPSRVKRKSPGVSE